VQAPPRTGGIDPAYTLSQKQKMSSSLKSDEKKARRPRLLFVVTEDWFFVSHFIGFARAARAEGLEIGLVARLGAFRAPLEAEGFELFALEGGRGSLAPGAAFREMAAIRAAITAFSPDIMHLIALRPVLTGSLAALNRRDVALVLAPTGLGYLWASASVKARLLSQVVAGLMRIILRRPRLGLFFENRDDAAEFGLRPDDPRLTLLGGAGVDADAFPARPDPGGSPVRFGLVARMLRSKGGPVAIEAIRRARAGGAEVQLDLFGATDPANADSMTEAELLAASAEPGIVWHGRVDDLSSVWRDVHVALLPTSYREGLPRALLEAAASGRPIITTDSPGCREIALDGKTGILVPPGDVAATAAAITRLAADAALRQMMGAASRAHFETRFTAKIVERDAVRAYRALLPEADLP
jgi:glycosyltransferase involved in cell wall biosynthesis